MEAKITQAARQVGMATSQRLDSEERVHKFLAQSRMMVALYLAGQKIPSNARRR